MRFGWGSFVIISLIGFTFLRARRSLYISVLFVLSYCGNRVSLIQLLARLE